jgi:HD-like signal output (HDOD) protein
MEGSMSAVLEASVPTADVEPIRTQLDSAIDALVDCCAHPDDPAFLEELRDAARGRGIEMPQLPEDLARVRLVLSDPEAGPRKLARAIRHSPVTAAQFIALANSTFFAGRHRIEHLEEAVVRIGMRQSATYLTAILAKASLFSPVGYAHQARRIFLHSLATAVCGEMIARTSNPDLAHAAFIAGLMHDFGRVYVLAIAGGQQPERSVNRGAPSASMIERASDALHAGFSGLVARGWAFEPSIAAAILDHHSDLGPLEDDESAERRLTRILRAADNIGKAMMEANFTAPEDLDQDTLDLLSAFDMIDELLEDARIAYESFEAVMS